MSDVLSQQEIDDLLFALSDGDWYDNDEDNTHISLTGTKFYLYDKYKMKSFSQDYVHGFNAGLSTGIDKCIEYLQKKGVNIDG